MNEPKFKQQGLLCRNGLDTKQILIHANFLTGSVICQKSFQTEKFPDFFRAKKIMTANPFPESQILVGV